MSKPQKDYHDIRSSLIIFRKVGRINAEGRKAKGISFSHEIVKESIDSASGAESFAFSIDSRRK